MGIEQQIARAELQIACPKCKKLGTLVTEAPLSTGTHRPPRVIRELSKGFLVVRQRDGGDERVECADCLIEVSVRSRGMKLVRRAAASNVLHFVR